MTATPPEDLEALCAQGLDWLLTTARRTETGLAWSRLPSEDENDFSLYGGTPGVVVGLLEGWRHFGDERYADAARRGAREVAAAVEDTEDSGLYGGRAGQALVLRAAHKAFGDDALAKAADRAMGGVRTAFDGTRWSEYVDLLSGNAGIALVALELGDVEFAVRAVEPYLSTTIPTENGVTWEWKTGLDSRFHHVSHGTLGIAYGLAAVGHAANRPDLLEAALAGVADVVARSEGDRDGFLVPHSDPPFHPELVARYNYGWCHGPAGDAHVFRLLKHITGDPAWDELDDRCWHTLVHSGIPERKEPGFWDNVARCCGTAGVLAFANDRAVERGGDLAFADTLVADLATRATVDGQGARWSNHEHTVTPPDLEAQNGLLQGNAGIVRELLRYARIVTGRDSGYAVTLPDQPVAVPAQTGV